MKIKTLAGDGQFMVKRRALALIKTRFEQAGIEIAFPTAQVAGGKPADVPAGAALQVGLSHAPTDA